MSISPISRYFKELSPVQQQQFSKLRQCYQQWNSRINVISRKDIENLYTHHVLHSLGIAKIVPFRDGAKVLDMGTGGGFPGIPLAILFPKAHFCLVDAIGKKITVVNAVAHHIGLTNTTVQQGQVKQLNDKYDFAISRAVAPVTTLYGWVEDKIKFRSTHAINNGMLCLKGGDLQEELAKLGRPYHVYPLSNYFEEVFFKTKKIVHIPIV